MCKLNIKTYKDNESLPSGYIIVIQAFFNVYQPMYVIQLKVINHMSISRNTEREINTFSRLKILIRYQEQKVNSSK